MAVDGDDDGLKQAFSFNLTRSRGASRAVTKRGNIVTSSDKNIAARTLKRAKHSRWISEAVPYGDNHRCLALMTLDPSESPALARQVGIPAGIASMRTDKRVSAPVRN